MAKAGDCKSLPLNLAAGVVTWASVVRIHLFSPTVGGKEMKKSSVCRIVRTVVLAVVLGVLQYKYAIGIVGSLLVALSSFT